MRREASGCSTRPVHQPGLQRVRSESTEKSLSAHACLPILWLGLGPRSKRGAKYLMGWAGPPGTRGDTCGDEPRIRGALASAECQPNTDYEATFCTSKGDFAIELCVFLWDAH